MLELFSTDAKGPIKILTEWTGLQLIPDLLVTLFLLPCSVFEWMNNGKDTCGYLCNKNSLYSGRASQSVKNQPATRFGCSIQHPAKKKNTSIPEITHWDEVINIRQSYAPQGVKFCLPSKQLSLNRFLFSQSSPLSSFLSLPTICHSPGGLQALIAGD